MDAELAKWILGGIAAVITTVIGTLLAKKDAAQEKQITELWNKHNDDAERLQQLELHVAKEHYIKAELDTKFDRLEDTFKEGLSEISERMNHMGNKFEGLANTLINLLSKSKHLD